MKTANPIRQIIKLVGALFVTGLLAYSAHAQWTQLLFTDNFYTGLSASPASATTNLNYNIGLAGGRQGGSLVEANPSGFGWSMYGKTVFTTGNGWDLRAQSNFPSTGPIDPWTLRYRDNVAGDWSTLTPDINFSSSIINNSYRIQAQFLHVHLDYYGLHERWLGITFGANSVSQRFVNLPDAGGMYLFASGVYHVWSDGNWIANGAVSLTSNGAFDIDLQVLNNIGTLLINGNTVATNLDFSGVPVEWIGFTAAAGTNSLVSTSTQFRFDNFAVSTIPEPTLAGFIGLGLALMLARRFWKS